MAIGLGLQGLNRANATINLLPENFIIQREIQSKRFSGLIAAALIWAIVGCLYAHGKQTLRELASFEDLGQGTLTKVHQPRQGSEGSPGRSDRAARGDLPGIRAAPRTLRPPRRRHCRGDPEGNPGGRVQVQRTDRRGHGQAGGPARAQGEDSWGPWGRSALAPTPEGTLVFQSGIVLTFTASCEATKEPSWLQNDLPAELAKAVVYPEKIGAIKTDGKGHYAISVSEVTLSGSESTRSLMAGVTDRWPAPVATERENPWSFRSA